MACFTKEYMFDEIMKFREEMGKKSFWENEIAMKQATKGLLYSFTKYSEENPGGKDLDSIIVSLISAIDEYDRRLILMLSKGM